MSELQNYDFLAGQAAEANDKLSELEAALSFTVVSAAYGQVAVFDGTQFVPGILIGDSNGVSVGVVTSPSFGIQITLDQNLKSTATPTFAGLTLSTTPLALTSGGTGANSASGARSSLGLGALATLGAAAASSDAAAAVGAAYVQAEVQAILDEMRDLKTKLRSAGILAT